jgi:hypothetical protein
LQLAHPTNLHSLAFQQSYLAPWPLLSQPNFFFIDVFLGFCSLFFAHRQILQRLHLNEYPTTFPVFFPIIDAAPERMRAYKAGQIPRSESKFSKSEEIG